MQADWSALPAVGGISIIETFDLQLHPLRLQVERLTGRRILKYIFAGSSETHAKAALLDVGDNNGEESQLQPARPRASVDSSVPPPPAPRRHMSIARSSSHQNLKAPSINSGQPAQRGKLKKVASSEQLTSRLDNDRRLRGINKVVDKELEEMKDRASRNRTFLHVSVSRYAILALR